MKTNHRKKGSKKETALSKALIIIAYLLILMLSVFLSSCRMDNHSLKKMLGMKPDQVQVNKDSVIHEMMLTFEEIEENLDLIKQKEGILELHHNGQELHQVQRKEIIKDIQWLNSLLRDSRKKVELLSQRLDESNIKLNSFKKKIQRLSGELAVQGQQMDALKGRLHEKNFRLSELNLALDTLRTTLRKQKEILKNQEQELHKGYYAYGTYNELKEQNVLTKNGGFLWIGRNTTLKEDFAQDYFTEIDIRETTKIPVRCNKAQLITEHPSGSYTFEKDEEDKQIAYLEIKDPAEFWKVNSYMVMEVKL